jgi:hypothetical protein
MQKGTSRLAERVVERYAEHVGSTVVGRRGVTHGVRVVVRGGRLDHRECRGSAVENVAAMQQSGN